jgi:hypothetical protein
VGIHAERAVSGRRGWSNLQKAVASIVNRIEIIAEKASCDNILGAPGDSPRDGQTTAQTTNTRKTIT